MWRKVGQRADRNSRYIHDLWARFFSEEDDSVDLAHVITCVSVRCLFLLCLLLLPLMELEWTIFQGSLHYRFSQRSREWWLKLSVNLSNSQEGLSSCQCTKTLDGEEKGNEALCIANSKIVADYARKFAHGHWSFLGLGSEQKWYGSSSYKPKENGMMSLNTCCSTIAKADIPYSVEPMLWNEELWKAKDVENSPYTTLLWWSTNCWNVFSHYHFRQWRLCSRSSKECSCREYTLPLDDQLHGKC